MTTGLNLKVLAVHLSGGELKELQRIATKPVCTEKETKFALAMAARTFKKVRNSLPVDQIRIMPEGANFLIVTNL